MPVPSAPSFLRFEHQVAGHPALGLGAAAPRLSWQVGEAPDGYRQAAYELEVRRGDADAEVVRVESAEQVLVPWPVAPLASRERAEVRVRVRGAAAGDWSGWSEPAVVETGLLASGDWTARFVSPCRIGGLEAPAPVLSGASNCPPASCAPASTSPRTVSTSRRSTAAASATPSSHPAGPPTRSGCATRPTTSPSSCRRAATTSTCCSATAGTAAGSASPAGVPSTATGWRCWPSSRSPPTTAPSTSSPPTTRGRAARATCSPTTSTTASGPTCVVRRSGTGEADAVDVLDADLSRLVAPEGPPVRITAVLPAVEVSSSPSGRTLVDFGQNVVGWVRLRVRGLEPGDEVTVRHAEVLEDGELGVRPLRTAKATDSWLVAGGDEEVLEPSLTFHGFRYAEVSGGRRPAGGRPRGRRRGHRPAPHRLVRLVARAAQPLPRERRLGHARQLRRRPDRLPAARRAPRLDRRHPGLLADRELPVRQRRVPQHLAGRSGRRAAEGRLRAVRRPRHSQDAHARRRGVGRRRHGRAVGGLPAQR